MVANIPAQISGQRYISLVTFRKNGVAVPTAVWFAEENGKLYVMTSDSTGKYKRIRNNSQVKVAPCTIRGRVTGPELAGTARILPATERQRVLSLIRAKYWLARLPFLWRNVNAYLEIAV